MTNEMRNELEKKKSNCPCVCYPRLYYERAIRKKGGVQKCSK